MTAVCHRHSTAGRIRRAVLAGIVVLLFCTPCAAADRDLVWVSGPLPPKGSIVIRSGLAWLDESSAAFNRVRTVLEKELKSMGFTIVPVSPSKREPMPETKLPPKERAVAPARQAGGKAAPEDAAALKAEELGKSGKLPQLKLRGYTVPAKDADLPPNVTAITPPDVTRALFARSQQMGRPEVRSFSIPGRMPEELAADAARADYAVLVKFAMVRVMAAAPDTNQIFPGGLPGVAVAAVGGGVQGVGRLGFGAPSSPSSSGQSTYGTPGGYVRGYENPSGSGDFWHRDYDFYQRDYQLKHGPEPQYATPPKGFTPYRGLSPAPSPPPAGTRASLVSAQGWHLLLLDCFSLAPMRLGKEAEHVWRAASRAPAGETRLEDALPKLTRAVFAALRD